MNLTLQQKLVITGNAVLGLFAGVSFAAGNHQRVSTWALAATVFNFLKTAGQGNGSETRLIAYGAFIAAT